MPSTKPIRLFCSDLDGTLIGESDAVADFTNTWNALGGGAKPVLVYSTGRLHDDARRAVEQAGLPLPDFFVTGVGTVIFHMAENREMLEFADILVEGWDPKTIREVISKLDEIEPQPPEHQHAWKCSWFWHNRTSEDIDHLRAMLAEAGIEAQVVYSSSRDLDILPLNANKGNSLSWLCKHLGIGLDEVAVAGDTGNDSSMFLVPGVRGIVPENAEPELLGELGGVEAFHATGVCAGGILQGLRHYGVVPPATLAPQGAAK